MEQRPHLYYFDYLRIFAAFCVIFMHTAADPLRAGFNLSWEGLNLLTSLSFTAVPLFFMMSGYLLLSGERTADISILVKKRLPKLVFPLAAWSLIYILWNLFQQGNLTLRALVAGILHAFTEPAAIHLWFLYMLIVLYLLSPFLYGAVHSLSRKGHLYLLLLIGAVTLRAMALPLLPEGLRSLANWNFSTEAYVFFGHLCSFLLGYYLGSLKREIPNGLLLAAAAVLWAGITLGTRLVSFRNNAYTAAFQQQHSGYEVVLAACIFLLCKQKLNRKPHKFLMLPKSQLLMAVYLLHNLLLSILLAKGIVAKGFFDTLLLTLANYGVSYCLVKTLASVKPLSYLFTGIPYKTACAHCNWMALFRREKG